MAGRYAFPHRRGYGLVLGVLIFLCLTEMGVVHLLLRNASVVLANVLLALSVYGIVWLLGDFHALRLRPIVVGDGSLRLRVGLRCEATISLTDVDRIESLPASGEPEPRSGYMRCTAFGPPEMLVRLHKAVRIEWLFGLTRHVSCIGLAVEDNAAFVRTVFTERESRDSPV